MFDNFKTYYINCSETSYNCVPHVLIIPGGNYTGSNLVAAIQELLNGTDDTFTFEVINHPARGTITIEVKPEGMHSNNKSLVPSDVGRMNWMSNTDSPWEDIEGHIQTVDMNSPRSNNGLLRNTEVIHLHQLTDYDKSYESGFIDLLNAHSIYLHCPNLGHYNFIGVRGANTIIKQTHVSSSSGYFGN